MAFRPIAVAPMNKSGVFAWCPHTIQRFAAAALVYPRWGGMLLGGGQAASVGARRLADARGAGRATRKFNAAAIAE